MRWFLVLGSWFAMTLISCLILVFLRMEFCGGENYGRFDGDGRYQ